jgi:hypothetical protein
LGKQTDIFSRDWLDREGWQVEAIVDSNEVGWKEGEGGPRHGAWNNAIIAKIFRFI